MALKSAGAKNKSPRNAIFIEQEHEKSQQGETKESNENSTKTEQKIKRKELHQQSKEEEKEKGLTRHFFGKGPDIGFNTYNHCFSSSMFCCSR